VRHKTVQPLPRYTRRKWLKGSQMWAYYFEPPTWARYSSDERGPCPVVAEDSAPITKRLRGVSRAFYCQPSIHGASEARRSR